MSARAQTATPPPLFLAVVHLLVFGGAACVAIELAFPELRQVAAVLFQPYAMGDLPRPLLVIGSAGCAVLLVALIARVALRKSVPLSLSIGILIFALLTFFPGPAPERRTWAGVDRAVLATVSDLQHTMVQTLQDKGEVPVTEAAWAQALASAAKAPLPVHAHLRALGYRLEWLRFGAELPKPQVPGTVVARVSPDGVTFALNAVGFDEEGRVAYLQDDRGELLTLRGLFNPSRADQGSSPGASGIPAGGF